MLTMDKVMLLSSVYIIETQCNQKLDEDAF